jgi:hypothetical protein
MYTSMYVDVFIVCVNTMTRMIKTNPFFPMGLIFRYAVRPGSSQNADVYLSNHKGGHNGWVQKWDPKFVRQIQDTFDRLKRYPFHILTHDIHCFTTLYGMLGRRNKDTARAAWQLLTKDGVPTNVREVLIVHVGGTCTCCVTSNTDRIMK